MFFVKVKVTGAENVVFLFIYCKTAIWEYVKGVYFSDLIINSSTTEIIAGTNPRVC